MFLASVVISICNSILVEVMLSGYHGDAFVLMATTKEAALRMAAQTADVDSVLVKAWSE